MTTLLLMLRDLVVLLLLPTLTGTRPGQAKRDSALAQRRFWISTMKVGGLVAVLRVSILWYLTYREWTGTQSLSLLPLILVLYPEGLLFPPAWSLTTNGVWLFSGLLAIGSLTMTSTVASLMAAASRLRCKNSS